MKQPAHTEGALNAATTFTGLLQGTTATFTGLLQGTTAVHPVCFTAATFTGSFPRHGRYVHRVRSSSTAATFTGPLQGTPLLFTGLLQGTTAIFSDNVTVLKEAMQWLYAEDMFCGAMPINHPKFKSNQLELLTSWIFRAPTADGYVLVTATLNTGGNNRQSRST
jgi:hypothetical protein